MTFPSVGKKKKEEKESSDSSEDKEDDQEDEEEDMDDSSDDLPKAKFSEVTITKTGFRNWKKAVDEFKSHQNFGPQNSSH